MTASTDKPRRRKISPDAAGPTLAELEAAAVRPKRTRVGGAGELYTQALARAATDQGRRRGRYDCSASAPHATACWAVSRPRRPT